MSVPEKAQGPARFVYAGNQPGVATYMVRYTRGEYLFVRGGDPVEVEDPGDIALLRQDKNLKEAKE